MPKSSGKIKKWCCRLIATPFLFAIGYFVLALLLGVLSTDETPKSTTEPKNIVIYVASNGVHLNLWLPSQNAQFDWAANYPSSFNNSKMAWTSIGWGSQAFYTQVPTWNDLTLPIAWQALTGDAAVIRLHGEYHAPPDDNNRRQILLSNTEYQMLIDDLQKQFKKNEPIAPFFYPALGAYSAKSTCNEWIRLRLSHIGLDMPLWSPFDVAVLRHLP